MIYVIYPLIIFFALLNNFPVKKKANKNIIKADKAKLLFFEREK